MNHTWAAAKPKRHKGVTEASFSCQRKNTMYSPISASSNAVLCVLLSQAVFKRVSQSDSPHYMSLGSIIHFFSKGKQKPSNVNTTPQQNIDLARYMGRWYEQARFENWFEKGMDSVYSDYSQDEKGRVHILNCGKNSRGATKQAHGRGFPSTEGKLQVSFVPPFWWFRTPYHILYVDAEYQSALVSGGGANYLWLLTRQRRASLAIMQALVLEAMQRGFDIDQLRPTTQDTA